MAQNIFEELQAKKQKLVNLASKAKQFGWIDATREKEIKEKLEQDVLTIGVIGQMKCGKSTFLNAFVFEDNILPAATTPMTAALSIITYGESKKVVAEFYTKDEWEEQKLNAARSLDEVQGNTLEESKIKAAKELVEKAGKLGDTLNNYLGKTKEDDFSSLIEYVGADGKYISITKSVTIYYPKEYLKGVEIVDTPGFNDPIVSREERTKAFLKKADVVLMMLYAGRPFDATDREILFQNVRQCGIGKVIIGINKYDIPYENGETEDEIKEYVINEIRNACKACSDDSLVEILRQTQPIPLSAEMALMSEMPMSKITSNEAFSHAWHRACDNFEISSQSKMREKSHLDDLTSAVKQLVETEKEQILFAKPLNAIMAAGNRKKVELEKVLHLQESMVENLNTPDDELEDKQEKLCKAERRLNKKINNLGDDLDSEFKQVIRIGKHEMEDAVDSACRKMRQVVDDLGRFSNPESIDPKLDAIWQTLNTRTLKRLVQRLSNDTKSKIKTILIDFTSEAQDILMRYVSDFDADSFVKSINKQIELDIENKDLFTSDNSQGEDNYGFGDLILDFFNSVSLGIDKKIFDAYSHNNIKQELHQNINSLSANFDPEPYLETIISNKDFVIELVKTSFIDDTIKPMREQIDEIRSKIESKEAELEKAKNLVDEYKKKVAEINKQLVDINN